MVGCGRCDFIQRVLSEMCIRDSVGTTGKQLKKIVRMQAWRLSAVGIPIGLLCGYLAGLCMAPSLTADSEIRAQAGQTAQTVVSANPLIFLAAALLTLLTVYLSSLQACKMCIRDRSMNSPLNTYILRLADVYLTYAEACLGNSEELTGGPDVYKRQK